MSHPLPTLGLARLLNGEEQVSDIIAFLAGLDPEPLRLALGLKVTSLNVVREAMVSAPQVAKRRSERVDLLIEDSEGTPLALVEVKIGAGQHGEQYALYETSAAERGIASNCWLVSLCGNDPDAPGTWRTDLTLPQLVGAWRQSTHPHAAWLGGLADDVLERRARQLDGLLGRADDPVVADLLVKQLEVDLERTSVFAQLRAQLWKGMCTAGGAPMLLVWTPMPGQPRPRHVS